MIKLGGNEELFIPVIFVQFLLGDAILGMGEEAIGFAIIIYPLMITHVAILIGFASSWMNPLQLLLLLKVLRTFQFCQALVFEWLCGVFALRYANKVKQNPEYSFSYNSDAHFRESQSKACRFNLGDMLVLMLISIMFDDNSKEFMVSILAYKEFDCHFPLQLPQHREKSD